LPPTGNGALAEPPVRSPGPSPEAELKIRLLGGFRFSRSRQDVTLAEGSQRLLAFLALLGEIVGSE
jgi:hypothetical protein